MTMKAVVKMMLMMTCFLDDDAMVKTMTSCLHNYDGSGEDDDDYDADDDVFFS